MTEQEWLTCPDAKAMLKFVRGRTSDRKLRLFAVESTRRLWQSLLREGEAALEIAALFADGHVAEQEREVVGAHTRLAHSKACYFLDVFLGVVLTVEKHATEAASRAAVWDFSGYRPREWQGFVPLLRHVVGNPFQLYPTCDHWPVIVVQLALAVYDGQDCSFALHDALIEAGHEELADRFRQEQHHPKGCWALDVILMKS
jgi:hypothetical protein